MIERVENILIPAGQYLVINGKGRITESALMVTSSPALRDALLDVLKAIVTDRHAVQDTLFVNGTPVGDFVACVLNEDINFEGLHFTPYKCKGTPDIFHAQREKERMVQILRGNFAVFMRRAQRKTYGTEIDRQEAWTAAVAANDQIEALTGARLPWPAEEGGTCPICLTEDALTMVRAGDCYCHTSPPCGSCTSAVLTCQHCGEEYH